MDGILHKLFGFGEGRNHPGSTLNTNNKGWNMNFYSCGSFFERIITNNFSRRRPLIAVIGDFMLKVQTHIATTESDCSWGGRQKKGNVGKNAEAGEDWRSCGDESLQMSANKTSAEDAQLKSADGPEIAAAREIKESSGEGAL